MQVKKDRGSESKLYQLKQGAMDRRQVGMIAEAAVLLRLVVLGLTPYGSPFDGDKIDWLVGVPDTGKTLKVQVKACQRTRRSMPGVSLTCTKGHNKQRRYEKGEFDFLVGYDFYTDTAYVWSWGDVAHLKTTVTVCPEAAEAWAKMRA